MIGGSRTHLTHDSWRGDIDATCRESSVLPKASYESSLRRKFHMTGLTEEVGIATALALAAWTIWDRARRLLKRRSNAAISVLSDRQLDDIGLTAADFRWAARQPLHIDASGELARIVCDRNLVLGQRMS
jgi:uncharacterized protein YjiS (DUF1127 family)